MILRWGVPPGWNQFRTVANRRPARYNRRRIASPFVAGAVMTPSQPTSPKAKRRRAKKPKLSRLYKPENLSLEEWQILLRRQFGREQKFRLKNLGDRPAFSEFLVTNPQSHNTYRVTVRGRRPGQNSCTCPDFATNSLGTCKHVEFVLA